MQLPNSIGMMFAWVHTTLFWIGMMEEAKDILEKVARCMKKYVDLEFDVGDQVFLKLTS